MSASTSDKLSIDEAAPLIGVSPRTLRDMCARKAIRFVRVGAGRGIYKLTREYIDEYLAAREVAPTNGLSVAMQSRTTASPSTAIASHRTKPSSPKPATLEKALTKLRASGVAK